MRHRIPAWILRELIKEETQLEESSDEPSDEIRHPKGPNSRDDAEDRKLRESFGEPLV